MKKSVNNLKKSDMNAKINRRAVEKVPLSIIGTFPSEWEQETLSSVCILVTDGTHDSPKEIIGSGFPLVTGKAIKNRTIDFSETYNISAEDHFKVISRSKPEKNDILFANIGSIGDLVRITNDDEFSIKNVALFKPNNRINARFLEYYLLSPQVQNYIKGTTRGSAQPFIGLSTLRGFPVPLPPKSEQEQIAAILGSIDDKINLNQRMNDTLEAIAQALFKSWFVNFDPIKAKAEDRKPEGMDDAIAALFPSNFTESSLGLIPEGWEVTTVEEIAQQIALGPFGSSIKVSTFVREGIPVISGQHLKNVMLTDNEFNFVTEEHAEKLKKANVKRGDVIFTAWGTIGQVSYIPEGSRFERYILSQRQFYLRCNEQKMSPLFMTYFFRSPEGQHRLLANASQTGVPAIARPVSYLRTITFVKPSKKVLEEFDKIILSLHRKILANSKEANNLAELRDLLLPRLISGKLRVVILNLKFIRC